MNGDATLFVVDDDRAVREAVARLARSAGLRAETFESAEEFLASHPQDSIGCVLLDLQMPGMNGMELQQRLAELGRNLPIVFMTGHGDVPTSVRAMKRGAVDFLTKPVDDVDLLEAVRKAIAGHALSRQERERRDEIARRVALLTPREHEVLRCLLSGAINKEIAAHLGTAEKTIKVHRARVLKKMGVASIAELVRCAALASIEPIPVGGRPADPLGQV